MSTTPKLNRKLKLVSILLGFALGLFVLGMFIRSCSSSSDTETPQKDITKPPETPQKDITKPSETPKTIPKPSETPQDIPKPPEIPQNIPEKSETPPNIFCDSLVSSKEDVNIRISKDEKFVEFNERLAKNLGCDASDIVFFYKGCQKLEIKKESFVLDFPFAADSYIQFLKKPTVETKVYKVNVDGGKEITLNGPPDSDGLRQAIIYHAYILRDSFHISFQHMKDIDLFDEDGKLWESGNHMPEIVKAVTKKSNFKLFDINSMLNVDCEFNEDYSQLLKSIIAKKIPGCDDISLIQDGVTLETSSFIQKRPIFLVKNRPLNYYVNGEEVFLYDFDTLIDFRARAARINGISENVKFLMYDLAEPMEIKDLASLFTNTDIETIEKLRNTKSNVLEIK